MKLPIDNRLVKKSEKNRLNRRNIAEILKIPKILAKFRDFISCTHVLEFLKKYW